MNLGFEQIIQVFRMNGTSILVEYNKHSGLRAAFRRWVFEELARQAIPAILVTHDREDCPPTGRCLAMERWQ